MKALFSAELCYIAIVRSFNSIPTLILQGFFKLFITSVSCVFYLEVSTCIVNGLLLLSSQFLCL